MFDHCLFFCNLKLKINTFDVQVNNLKLKINTFDVQVKYYFLRFMYVSQYALLTWCFYRIILMVSKIKIPCFHFNKFLLVWPFWLIVFPFFGSNAVKYRFPSLYVVENYHQKSDCINQDQYSKTACNEGRLYFFPFFLIIKSGFAQSSRPLWSIRLAIRVRIYLDKWKEGRTHI